MKNTIFSTFAFLMLFIFSDISSAQTQADRPIEWQRLLGTWSCSIQMDFPGGSVSIVGDYTYVRNGRANSSSLLKLSFTDEGFEAEYWVVATSTWEMLDGYLVETLTDVRTTPLAPSEFDDYFDINMLFPIGLSDSSQIVNITAENMLLTSEEGDVSYECTRGGGAYSM